MIPLLAIKTALGGAWGFISKLPATTIIIAVLCSLSAFLWHNADGWKAKAERCATGRAADRKAYSDAQASATMIALANKRDTEARYAKIEKDKSDEISAAHDANRAALARWVRDHTAQGVAQSTDLSATATPTGKPDSATQQAVVPVSDLERCSDAFTIAQGWQDWYSAIQGSAPVPK